MAWFTKRQSDTIHHGHRPRGERHLLSHRHPCSHSHSSPLQNPHRERHAPTPPPRGGTHAGQARLPQAELCTARPRPPAEAPRTARMSWPKWNCTFIGFMHKELDTSQWNAEELTVALSRTFTESSSATLCFRSASSSVQRGRFSHLPNTTRSMSLDTEHTPKGVGRSKNRSLF